MDFTLYELIDAYEFADIEDTFVGLYKNYKRNAVGFEEVFETLKDFEDIPLSEYTICITHVNEEGEDFDSYDHITGYSEKEDLPVCLSFTPWNEWMGMKIDSETLKNYSGEQIICHCLWEMTFYGFNEDNIQKVIKEISEATFEETFEEIEEIEEEAESKELLKEMLKYEIESSSSSDER